MMILQAFDNRHRLPPRWRVQAFVLTRLNAFNWGDPRWTLAALALRLLGATVAFGERQLSRWARHVLRRALQGARFASAGRDRGQHADTMLAAGRR
jgi:hypothetical protein